MTDRIGQETERLLLGDEIVIGDKLPSERELAVQLGVSRPVVREALGRLQERGLVDVQPGRGTFYRPAEPSDAAGSLNLAIRRHVDTPAELIAARKMLECESAALAALHRSDDDCVALEAALAGFAGEAEVLERARLDIAFHDRIAQASANPVIRLMFASISDITVGLMVRSLSGPQVSRQGLPLHDEVCAAIIANDPERARAAMGEHLGAAEQLYGADLHRNIADLIPQDLRTAFNTLGISPSRDGHLR